MDQSFPETISHGAFRTAVHGNHRALRVVHVVLEIFSYKEGQTLNIGGRLWYKAIGPAADAFHPDLGLQFFPALGAYDGIGVLAAKLASDAALYLSTALYRHCFRIRVLFHVQSLSW